MKNNNVKRSAIGRVTITLKTEVNDFNTQQITSDYLHIKPTSDPYIVYYIDGTAHKHPGLIIRDNDPCLSEFIIITTETGYSLTIAKDSILMIETEMFTVESEEVVEEEGCDVH